MYLLTLIILLPMSISDEESSLNVSNVRMEDFGVLLGMGIPWGFPQVFLWVWDGCGD